VLATLLFFHILAAIGLFTGAAIEILALVRLKRAATLKDVRAALLNAPVIGPCMGLSVLLLLAMGIGMIYAGHFGWSAGWINVVFGLTIVLAIIGPAINGRRIDALHARAAQAGDGALTPEIDAARRDRVLHYTTFMSLFELIAALYIMVAKPDAGPAATVVIAAAVLAALPAALLLRPSAAAITAETQQA
jgi:hypothetical protein